MWKNKRVFTLSTTRKRLNRKGNLKTQWKNEFAVYLSMYFDFSTIFVSKYLCTSIGWSIRSPNASQARHYRAIRKKEKRTPYYCLLLGFISILLGAAWGGRGFCLLVLQQKYSRRPTNIRQPTIHIKMRGFRSKSCLARFRSATGLGIWRREAIGSCSALGGAVSSQLSGSEWPVAGLKGVGISSLFRRFLLAYVVGCQQSQLV